MHGDATPASLMLTALPAMVAVAERGLPVFEATKTTTDPAPDPPGPTPTQFASIAVVHPQPSSWSLRQPPSAASVNDIDVGVIV